MTFGLQCFSASGQVILDTDSFLTRYLTTVYIRGTQDYSPWPPSGTIQVPELAGVTRFWFKFYRTLGTPYYINYGYGPVWTYLLPTITFSGTTLNWVYTDSGPSAYYFAPTTVIIGAY